MVAMRLVQTARFDLPDHAGNVQLQRAEAMARRKTVPHMVAEKQFQRGAARLVDFLRFAFDDHAGHGPGGAGGHQPALAVGHHLDQANQAGGQRPALFQVAKGWNVQADPPRRLQDRLARRNFAARSLPSISNLSICALIAAPFDGVLRADLAAGVAARADFQVDFMPRVRRHRDGVDRAMLGAEGAAGAGGGDVILDKRGALAGRAAALQVGLVFVAEITQGREHRDWARSSPSRTGCRR